MADPFQRNKAQSRAVVQQLKLIGQSHQTGLTPNLLRLFEPRPPLEHVPPLIKRKLPPYNGIAQYVQNFADPGEPEYSPPVTRAETKAEKKERIKDAKLEAGQKKIEEEIAKYDPASDPHAEGDPYKTLFVARISYETTEQKLMREFEAYGPVKKIRLVQDVLTDKPRGYAFIEYYHTRDMKTAYKQADGRKIDNRRVLVDVERGRTVPNWRPRRLGGGMGSTRMGGDEVNQRFSGREPQGQISSSRHEEPERRDPERRHERERGRDNERERGDSDGARSRERGRDREVRERDRERDRERGRDRDRGKDRERDREREKDKDKDRDRERDRGDRGDRDRDRDRERERERGDRDRHRDKEREREKDRHRDRDRDKDKDKDKERERERGKDRDRERGDKEREKGREKTRERDPEEKEHGELDH